MRIETRPTHRRLKAVRTWVFHAGAAAALAGCAMPTDATYEEDGDEVAVTEQALGGHPASVVISQIFPGGQSAGATYSYDYVELYNRSDHAVTMTNWSLQYASATGTGNFGQSGIVRIPTMTLQPNRYLLVQMNAIGPTPPVLPSVTADVKNAGTIQMSATSGKIALAKISSSLGCNGSADKPCSAAQQANIVDLVGYGSAANYAETAPTANASPTTTVARGVLPFPNGCPDTDNNGADFVLATPQLRNNGSVNFFPCNAAGATP
jgi:hypothetical protein